MKTKLIAFLFILSFGITSCTKSDEPVVPAKHTLLIYMMANNDLNRFGVLNLDALMKVATKKNLNGGNLIVYYTLEGATPQLLQLKENSDGKVIKEVVLDYEKQNSASPEVLLSVIKEVVSRFPADSYGLDLWSHGSAWVPSEYQNMMKAFGQDGTNWMEIDELAKGIPNGLFNYILFDACYMASVECIYELKDKANYILASPTETMGDGWPYEKIIPVFFENNLQLEKAAEIFYNYYNALSGNNQTATVSVAKTSEIENLTAIVKEILADKSEEDIFNLDLQSMQRLEYLTNSYYTLRQGFLYDFDDFIKQLATAGQYEQFQAAMGKLITYEAHTKNAFFGALGYSKPIDRCCGLTVFVPQQSIPKINEWYKTRVAWEKAVYPN
ncbi:clostripain-related cysteine peptidase [Parabacteroides sp. APC149_11_2_Y6]